MIDYPLIGCIGIILLIYIKAEISKAKSAISNLNDIYIRKRAEEEKDRDTLLLVELMDKPESYIFAIDIIITTISVLCGFLYYTCFVGVISKFCTKIEDSGIIVEISIHIVGVSLLVIFVTLFGSLIPKKIALRDPEKRAYRTIGLMMFLMKVMRPITFSLQFMMNTVIRLSGIDPDELNNNVTEEEIISMVTEGHEQGVFEATEVEMISNIMEFDEKEVKDVMTHRKNVVFVNAEMTLEEVFKFMLANNYSRYPVYEGDINNIIGMLHVKDIARQYIANNSVENDNFNIINDYDENDNFEKEINLEKNNNINKNSNVIKSNNINKNSNVIKSNNINKNSNVIKSNNNAKNNKITKNSNVVKSNNAKNSKIEKYSKTEKNNNEQENKNNNSVKDKDLIKNNDYKKSNNATKYNVVNDNKLVENNNSIKAYMRKPYFVPEKQSIDVLFNDMQIKKTHIAIVIDEYGQTSGIVAFEDIIEEIVGNILDEYDEEEKNIIRQPNGNYFMKGMTPLSEVEDKLNIDFDGTHYETLNGLLVSLLQRIPKEGEKVTVNYKGYNFDIIDVNNKIIRYVRAKKVN